ncbi:mechanosensitive ion channel family protein [Proteobacteria bacterium 005FR1]|nr:mechanosensitive ion channel family protein [Proteobacteria bacterium 005FR1]
MTWWLLRKTTSRIFATDLLLKYAAAPARYLLPLILLQFVWLAAPELDYVPLLALATRVLLIIAFVWLVTRSISAVTESIIAAQPIAEKDNMNARRIQTQATVISRSLKILVIILGFALVLMTFPGARALGTSLLASAGLAGIIAGVAARPVLSNLIAGMQIALSQPFRIDDVLIVQGEWGRVEEITSTYVSLMIWDERRLVIPLQWFIENSFENWTRHGSQLLGTVFWWVDYRMPLEPLREELRRLCESAQEWDGRACAIVVTDVSDRAVQIRALVSADNSGDAWNLRCKIRESMIHYMQEHYADYLPRQRNEVALEKRNEAEQATGKDQPKEKHFADDA